MMRTLPILAIVATLTVPFTGASPSESMAGFGGAIVAGDGYLFVAEPRGFKNPGMVHVYVRGADQEWLLRSSLRAPNAHVNDGFGSTIAYGNGTLVVASASAVYVFEQEDGTGNFVQTGRLASGHPAFGSALTADGGWIAVGTAQRSAGDVFVFYRNPDGAWVEGTRLADPNAEAESMYGMTLSMDQGRLLGGSPGACSAFLYEQGDDEWELVETFSCGELGTESAFAASVDLKGNRAAIGAPRHNSGVGAVAVWRLGDGENAMWSEGEALIPTDQSGPQFFGAQVQVQDPQWIVVGAPMASDMDGAVHVYPVQENGYAESDNYTIVRGPGPRFGSVIAIYESVIAVGAPGAAYGEGSALLVERTNEFWEVTHEIFNAGEPMSSISGTQVTCAGGEAESYDCGLVDMLAFLPNQEMEMNRGVRLSDVWGWTDPETGIEYGLIGHLEGTVFIDLSDPSMPKYLGTLPRTEGSPGSTWRDIKVYKDHAFIVADGAREHGMQVFHLTQLREVTFPPVQFAETAHYDKIHSAHNIVINEDTGFAFAVGASGGAETCGGGLHMIDIREPQAPVFAGCFADETTGRRKTGYSHDAQCVIYNGPDAEYVGREICIGANETAISIADVTDKDNPVAVGTGSYPDAGYVHQGWLSEDHSYFYQNDELDEIAGRVDKTRTLVWDVRDLSDPIMIREFYGPTSATDHNLYVHGDLMYQTNNASGLRLIDVSTPDNPVEIGYFDTTPYGTDEAGFNGTWSSYPYFKSGIIVVTSRREGVFILKKQTVDT
ncbi:MAG: choice-of-anchor B family protein [Bacteroidota bacterium]|nr:choice-of-anchor B family protein [Bacteroidota bacterium]